MKICEKCQKPIEPLNNAVQVLDGFFDENDKFLPDRQRKQYHLQCFENMNAKKEENKIELERTEIKKSLEKKTHEKNIAEFTEENRKTVAEILTKIEAEKKLWTDAKLKVASAQSEMEKDAYRNAYSKSKGNIEGLYWALGKNLTKEEWRVMMWNRPIKELQKYFQSKNNPTPTISACEECLMEDVCENESIGSLNGCDEIVYLDDLKSPEKMNQKDPTNDLTKISNSKRE